MSRQEIDELIRDFVAAIERLLAAPAPARTARKRCSSCGKLGHNARRHGPQGESSPRQAPIEEPARATGAGKEDVLPGPEERARPAVVQEET